MEWEISTPSKGEYLGMGQVGIGMEGLHRIVRAIPKKEMHHLLENVDGGWLYPDENFSQAKPLNILQYGYGGIVVKHGDLAIWLNIDFSASIVKLIFDWGCTMNSTKLDIPNGSLTTSLTGIGFAQATLSQDILSEDSIKLGVALLATLMEA